MQCTTLTRRADFLAAARSGAKCARPLVVVQGRRRAPEEITNVVRIGFTATKALGGAVMRNRAKRRLREAALRVVPELALPGCDYVFIGRGETGRGSFDSLIADMKHALKRLSEALSR